MIISTAIPILGTTKDDGKCKQAIMKLYDFTKGRTDIINQRIVIYYKHEKQKMNFECIFIYA